MTDWQVLIARLAAAEALRRLILADADAQAQTASAQNTSPQDMGSFDGAVAHIIAGFPGCDEPGSAHRDVDPAAPASSDHTVAEAPALAQSPAHSFARVNRFDSNDRKTDGGIKPYRTALRPSGRNTTPPAWEHESSITNRPAWLIFARHPWIEG